MFCILPPHPIYQVLWDAAGTMFELGRLKLNVILKRYIEKEDEVYEGKIF